MTNVHEVLKEAIETFEIEGIGSCDAANLCKAALAEIEKCEPVAWRHKEYPAELYGSLDEFQNDFDDVMLAEPLYVAPQPIEKCEPVAYIHTATNTDKDGLEWVQLKAVYTSPQPMSVASEPREWVGVSDEMVNELAYQSRNDVAGTTQGYTTQEHYFAGLISAKLKQLNTKG